MDNFPKAFSIRLSNKYNIFLNNWNENQVSKRSTYVFYFLDMNDLACRHQRHNFGTPDNCSIGYLQAEPFSWIPLKIVVTPIYNCISEGKSLFEHTQQFLVPCQSKKWASCKNNKIRKTVKNMLIVCRNITNVIPYQIKTYIKQEIICF